MGRRLTQDEILEALRVRCKERGESHTFAIEYYNNANDWQYKSTALSTTDQTSALIVITPLPG